MVEFSTTVSLDHIPRRMVVLSPKTSFTVDGKKYYWKGYTDLFEEKTDKLVAQYLSSLNGGAENIGELIVTESDNKQLNDLVVISAVVMQHRSQARERAVSRVKIRF
jgi:hypothetical protein